MWKPGENVIKLKATEHNKIRKGNHYYYYY